MSNVHDKNIKLIYDKLTSKGVDMGTLEETTKALRSDPRNGRLLYDMGTKHGYDMGSYEEFEEAMGLPKFQAPLLYGEEPIEVNSAQPKAEEPKKEEDYLTSDMPEEAEAEEEYDFNREVLKDYVPQFKNEIKEKFPNARMYGFTRPTQMSTTGTGGITPNPNYGTPITLTEEEKAQRDSLDYQLKRGQITKEQYADQISAINKQATDRLNDQFSEDTLNASAALHLMTQAQKRVKLVDGRKKSRIVNTFRGIGHFDYAGLNPTLQYIDAYRSFALLNKVAENPDAELSESEQYLLQAIVTNNAVNDTFQTNMAERIGQGLPESMAFMAQFALTGGVGSAVGKLAKEGVEEVLKKGLKNATRRLYDDGFKGLVQKGLDRTLNTVIPGVVGATTAAATQTVLNPASLASGTYERAAGIAEYTLAPDGTPIATGEVTGRMGLDEAFAKEFGAQTIEQLSERAGASLGIGLGAGKAVAKTTGKTIASKVPRVQKAADAFVDFADNMKKTKVGDLVGKAAEWLENKDLGVKALAQKVGWNGTIEEWYEEQANTVLNALFVGDEELSALFNGQRQLETFLSVAVVGGATRLLSVPAAIEQRAEVRKEKQNLKNTISDIEKRVRGNSTMSHALKAVATAVDTGTVEDVALAINEANRQLNLDTDTKRMFLDYASARMMSNMWHSNDRRQASKLAEGVYKEVEARTHKQSGTITVAEYTDAQGNKQNVDIIDGVIIRDGDKKIDSTLSDRSVVIRFQDGTTKMVPSKSLGNIVEEIDPAQYRAKLADASVQDMESTFSSEYSARTNKHGVYYNEDGSLDYYHATPAQTALSLIDELGSAEAAAEYAANQLIGLQGAEMTSAEGGDGMSIKTQNALSKWQAVSGLLADITAYNAQQAAAAEGKAPEGVEPMENPLPVDAAAPARNLRAGDRLRLTLDNGEMAEATIGGKTADGNYIVDFEDNVTIGGKKGASHELTPEVIAAMQYVEEVQEGEEELQAEQTPEQDDVSSYKDMVIGRIPLKADGSRNWEAATPTDAAQAVNAERDGDFDASIAFAQQMAQNCANAVADLANTELEVEDPTNADMVAAAEAQRAQAIASMQKTSDFWDEVTNILNTANTERTKPAEQEAPAVETTTVEESPTSEDSMPMLDEDTPDFVSAGPERSAEFLSEQFGDDAEGFIQDNIAEAQKSLADAQGKKSKSTNFAERKRENEAIAQEKMAATAALDFWNAVGAAYAARQSATVEEVAQPEVVEESTPTTPAYRLSDEIDENGRQFVETSDGNIEFGMVESESGLTAAPILLSEGMITNPQTNDGYGLVHIEARHGDQIRKAGYKSVVDFIEEVAKGYTTIREGKKRDGQQTYLLQLTDKHNNTLMVELASDGTYWNINTAGIFKTSYGKNGKVVYNRYTTAKQTAESVEVSQESEQSGSTETPSISTPASPSTDKTTTSEPEKQISAQENVEEPSSDDKKRTPTEKEVLQQKIQEWLSADNIAWAEGRTLDESIEMFGNETEPIAVLPDVIREIFPELTSQYLYSGKGYLIDHAANHHPELEVEEYNKIQEVLDSYDDIKDLSTPNVTKIAFVKMVDKGFAVVTELSEKDGRIMLHKTFFYKDVQGRRTPYRNKPSVLKKASVDGSTTISPAETAAGRHREISALDASTDKTTTSEPEKQISAQENVEVAEETAATQPEQVVEEIAQPSAEDVQPEATEETTPAESDKQPEQEPQRDNFEEAVANQGYIERKPAKSKFSVWDFVAGKEVRPTKTPTIFEGVYYDKGFRVASDGKVLVKEKNTAYPAEYEGTARMRDGARTDEGVKYPPYERVIPAYKQADSRKIDFADLLGFLNAVKERVTAEHKATNQHRSLSAALNNTPISMRLANGQVVSFSLAKLMKFALAAKQIGADRIYGDDWTRAILAKNKNGELALLVPVRPDVYPFDGSTRYYYAPELETKPEPNKAPTEEVAEEKNAPTETTEEPTPTAQEGTSAKIEDFGEKIGGARKDVARQRIKDSMAYSRTDLVNLKDPDKILSRANIIKYVREGEMTIQDATTLLALNMAVRGEDLRKGLWLEKYRDAAFAWSKGQDVAVEVTDKDVDEVVESLGERARQRANIRQVVREGLELTLGTYTDYKTTYEALNYPEVNRMMKSVYIRVGRLDGKYWVVASPKASRGWPYATMSQAVAKMQVVCPVIPEEDSSKGKEGKDGKDKIGHLHIVKDERGYYRIKSRNIPGSIYLSKRFNSEKVAEQYLKDNAQELIQREIMMTAALMGSNIGMVERQGPDYRNGRDVTPQDFLDTFGVRGVEFGNWVPQIERQLYLNKSYDAIMDLCMVVGISPKAFSLGGRLALAFGSRGKSRALAHYEPLKEVINLTRMKGAGSLAHEWFHALDNYLSRQVNGNVGSMTTRDFRAQRSEVAQAFRDFVHKMGELAYSRRSSLAGPYWGEVWERAARLFESYVYNKLAEQNIESPLLVREDSLYDESNPLMGESGQSAWPYPSAEENEVMKPYFDTLFDTIQEREENGKAVLYQIEDSDLNTAEAKMSTEEVLDLVKAAGIEVEIATPESISAEEQEIIAKAKANGTYLKAPNGKPSNLTPRQWVQVRTKAFKRWFGDWEKALRIEKLRKSQSIEATGEEYVGKYELNNKSAANYINSELRGEYTNADTGDSIKITRKGAFKVTRHDAENEAHLKSIALIPSMLENAIFITEEKNEKGNTDFDSYRYYVVGINMGGVDYTAKLVIGTKNGETYYDHSLTEIEKTNLIDRRDEISSSFTTNEDANFEYKDKRLISILQTNSSKVVDANGEPLVVYHGSNWKGITTFDRSQSKRRRSGLREYGHFFTTNRALAEMYAAVEDAPDVKEEIDSLDAQIEQAAEAKDIGKMLDLYTEKERITRNLGGRVYEVFLNLRDVAEFDADYQADKGWYNLKADVGYKTAIGRDAMEAYAGQNSMTGDRLRKEGIIGRNIIDLFVGTENKEALKPYYDKYGGDVFLVFDPQNIKSATENVGIFDANNPDIRYLRGSSEGEVYGWMSDGKIYLTEKGLNPETPIHEYTHIWDAVCQKENPELWAEGVALMKQTPLWEQVRTNPAYADIANNENALASEVHARLVAPGATTILVEMMEQQKAEATLIGRIHNWIRKFWRWLRKKEMPESKLNVDKFARMPLKDLAMGKRLLNGIASANGKQKVAGQEIMDAFGNVPMAQIGRRRQEEMYAILAKRRQDLSDAEKLAVIAELDKLDNNKLVNAAFHYFVNGTVRLPEDMPKVEQAVKVAEIAKVDPAAYKSPMELINAHADVKLKEARIDPDTVPTLSNKVEYEDGITVYDVEDSEESRQNMRRIINTHFGEDSSPWCLLQGDGKGNLTGDSARYWAHYNAQPKRVAFQNGKLLAFFASDSEPTWWDRQDEPHTGGIPAIRKLPDGSGRVGTVEFNETTLEWGEFTNIRLGKRGDKIYEEWLDEDKIDFREIREGDVIYGYDWGMSETFRTYTELRADTFKILKSVSWDEDVVETVSEDNTLYDYYRGRTQRIQELGNDGDVVEWGDDGSPTYVKEGQTRSVWFGPNNTVKLVRDMNAEGSASFLADFDGDTGRLQRCTLVSEDGVKTFVSWSQLGLQQYRVGQEAVVMVAGEIVDATEKFSGLTSSQAEELADKVKQEVETRVPEYVAMAKAKAAEWEAKAGEVRERYSDSSSFEQQGERQLAAATSKGNIRYRTKNMQPRPFEEEFALLQQRYEALDKNDTEALEAFRAEKRNLVKRYWESLSEELGFETEIILVDSTNNPEALRPIYEVFLDGYDAKMKAEGEELYEMPSFEKFLEEWNRGTGIASHINGTKYIAADIARFDHRNDKKILTQILLHEYIHYLIDTNIDTDVLTRIGDEVSDTRLGQSIKETYGEDTSTLGDEMLAYTIAGYENTDINPLLGYIQGEENISTEEVMNNYDKSLPLRNDFAKHIINLLRDGYIGKQDGQTSNTDTRRTPKDKREVGRVVPQIYAEEFEKSDTDRKGDNRRGRDGGEWANIAAQAQTLSTAEIEEYVNEVAKSLPEGVKVVVTNSVESGDREHTGWYDMGTDTVYINADMCDNTADVDATIVHELVGHRSMPTAIARVIGTKNVTDRITLYTKLATMLPKELLDRVMAKTAAEMNLGVAVDEVLAEAVENADLIKPSLWQRICSEVRAFFRRVLNRGISLTDGDIKYMFWLAAHNINNDAEFVAAEEMRYRTGVAEFKRNSALPTEEQQEYDSAVISKSQKFVEEWVDSLNPLKKLQETVAKHHGELKSWENAYDIELGRASRTMARSKMMGERFLKPLITAISAFTNNGISREEVNYYMIAKHGLERNEYFRNKRLRELNAQINEFAKEVAQGYIYKDLSNEEKAILVKSEFMDYEPYLNMAEVAKALEWYASNDADYTGSAITDIEAIPLEDMSGLTGLAEVLSEDPDVKPEEIFTEVAEKLVEEFEGENGEAVNTLWDKVRDLTNATLLYQTEGGILSQEQYQNLRSMYRYYIPLRGWAEETSDAFYEYPTSDARLQTVVNAAKGRKSLAEDPIANMANMLESAVFITEKNAAKQALVRMALNRADNSLLRVVKMRYVKTKLPGGRVEWTAQYPTIPEKASQAEVDAILAQFDADTKAMVKAGTARVKRSQLDVGVMVKPKHIDAHFVKAMINGEEVAVIINATPAAAIALNGDKTKKYDDQLKTMGALTRFYAKAHTTWAPKFVVTNFLRDWGYSSFSAYVRYGARYTTRFEKNILKWKGMVKMMSKDIHNITEEQYNDHSLIANPTLRYFVEFLTNGGETGFSTSMATEEWKKEIDKQLSDIKGSKLDPRKAVNAMLNLLEFANRYMEDVPRFAAYLTSREMGKNVAESIKDAKEITVNFSRHGAGGSGNVVIRKLYAFANAGIQGLYNLTTLAKEHPKRFYPAVGTIFLSGFAIPLLNILLISAFGDDDDERNYKYMSEFNNTNRLVLFNPFDKDGGFITLPISQSLVPFYGLGNIFSRRIMGYDADLSLGGQIASTILAASPLSFISDSARGLDLAGFAPSFFQPIADVLLNKDFMGNPIFRSYDYGNGNTNKGDAAFTKAPIDTWQWLVWLSKQTSRLTGGDGIIRRGLADFNIGGKLVDWQINNPAITQYLLESYLGGALQSASKLVNLGKGVVAKMTGDETRAEEYLAAYNLPLVSGLYRFSNETSANSRIKEAYDHYRNDVAKQCERAVKTYMEELPADLNLWPKAAVEVLNSTDYQIYKLLKGYDKPIRKAEKLLSEAYDRKAPKAEIDELKRAIMAAKMELIEAASDIQLRGVATKMQDNN